MNKLKNELKRIDHKGYPAYKDLKGSYDFVKYTLNIEHVQGDPFASPSALSVRIKGKTADFPKNYYDVYHRRIALEDFILRKFSREVSKISFKAKGSGKSGMVSASQPGQEIMERSACHVDEKTGDQVGPKYRPITSEYLDYDEVMERYDEMMDWLADLYVNTLNLIQYMHDKYYYEAAEMALIDTDVKRTFATGIAGFSHVVDSLSAIKYAKVKTVRDETGIVVDYEIEGDFPKYGNDDDRADDIAVWLLKTFLEKIKKRHTYRDSEPTTSILTITSNVVYGKYTGAMPDGRKAGTPLAPGANPSYGAEQNGLLASLNSLTKLPYEWALDGISNTQTMNPDALGHNEEERINNLVNVMDGYFDQGAHHLNVNVFGKDKLLDAMEHPEKPEYANFTIRVSGYAVKFIDLTKEQQMDVISRTFHDRM